MFSENDDYLILKRLKKKFDNFRKAIQNSKELLCKVIARNPKNSEAKISRWKIHKKNSYSTESQRTSMEYHFNNKIP